MYISILHAQVQSGSGKYDAPKTTEDDILMGNLQMECPTTAKVVRIFTSSTFTGTYEGWSRSSWTFFITRILYAFRNFITFMTLIYIDQIYN